MPPAAKTIIAGFFKLSVEILKGLESGKLDPFEIMKREFARLIDRGIKPVIIIDELQANFLIRMYLVNPVNYDPSLHCLQINK